MLPLPSLLLERIWSCCTAGCRPDRDCQGIAHYALLSVAAAAACREPQEGGPVLVRVLSVPQACQPGDGVFLEGGSPPAEYPKECKSKVGSCLLLFVQH